ncbi:MAG: M48 family metallopeptidase [Methylocystis sp.]|nr:M48 family metallopeptidase [Methylocystis sp.]
MTLTAAAIYVAIVLSGALGVYLRYRQGACVLAHRERVPADFAGEVSLEDHRRAADYTLARTRLATAAIAYDAVLTVAWLTVGLAPLYAVAEQHLAPGLTRSVAVVVAVMLIGHMLELPFSLFSTFRLEAQFGFNRATPGVFVRDQLQTGALWLLLGVPLLYGLFALLRAMPDHWWLFAYAGAMVVMMAMIVIYPAIVAPLFNDFVPLADGAMKSRLESLLSKCGFESKGLFVMDASKRSAHGNAYFSGMGKAKRIVFFDTLLAKHSLEEIESILAHELGHFKLGHIRQRLLLAATLALVGFAILRWAFADGGLAAQFGLPDDPGLALIIILMAGEPALHLLSPLLSWLSRRAEFQADYFAKAIVGKEAMVGALTKLSRDNLATLTPDRLYWQFYYSHPPVGARIARLNRPAPGAAPAGVD